MNPLSLCKTTIFISFLFFLNTVSLAEEIAVTDENINSFASLGTKGVNLYCYEYPNGRLALTSGKKELASGISCKLIKDPRKKIRKYKKKITKKKNSGVPKKVLLKLKKKKKSYSYGKKNCKSIHTQNLQIISLSTGSVLYAGHSSKLKYTLTAAEAINQPQNENASEASVSVIERPQNVITSFYLVSETEYNSGKKVNEIINQIYLGGDNLLEVPAGNSEHTIDIKVPSALSSEGNYYIFAIVDPDDLIAEKNEDDNQLKTKGKTSSTSVIQVSRQFVDVPNFKILSLELEDSRITAQSDSDDILNSVPVAFSHITPKNFDLSQFPYRGNVEIKGVAEVLYDGVWPSDQQDLKVALEININGTWTRLESWDNLQGKFADYVTVSFANDDTPAEPGDENFENSDEDNTNIQTIDLDINIPVSALDKLIPSIPSLPLATTTDLRNVGVRLVIDSEGSVSEAFEDDNTYEFIVDLSSLLTSSVNLRQNTMAGSNNYMFEKSFEKYVGKSSKVKTGVKLYSKAGIETSNPYGAVSNHSVEVPLWLFKNKNILLKVADERSAYADWMEKTGYKTEIIYLNSTLYDQEAWYDRVTKSYGRSWEKEKRIMKTRFVVGPIPMSVSVYVSGTVGVDIEIGLDDNYLLSENTLPEIDFNLDLDGGVDVYAGEAGVTSRLTLLKETFKANGYAEFDYDSEADSLLKATLKAQVINDLEAIRGRFGLYARWKTIQWCKKLGVPYPCGKKSRKKTIWFYKTKALYDKKETLLDKKKSWDF